MSSAHHASQAKLWTLAVTTVPGRNGLPAAVRRRHPVSVTWITRPTRLLWSLVPSRSASGVAAIAFDITAIARRRTSALAFRTGGIALGTSRCGVLAAAATSPPEGATIIDAELFFVVTFRNSMTHQQEVALVQRFLAN
ncbi:hypothetical protein DOTSEDRAFT_42557 [Dothistroma septosporum NZE10]|uniref:Uncharacterized protein n=1 Tax=Dothistroma septosporum (strain NZE10 / CBS 128990) TaxID=675120 RepID=N1PU98_DOTSN|nr:hypothetical protein DOTSEDRAFT_42557 [Dothistroma septosporum NZE10]